TLTLAHDVLSHNQALGPPGVPGVPNVNALGGAIRNQSGATLTVTDSLFTANQAVGGDGGAGRNNGSGGAISNDAATATVSRSTSLGNQARGGNGGIGTGGFFVDFAPGGGIANAGRGALTVDQCTFTDNQALGGSGGRGNAVVSDGHGGGIHNELSS